MRAPTPRSPHPTSDPNRSSCHCAAPKITPILEELLGDPQWNHVRPGCPPEMAGRYRLDHDNTHFAAPFDPAGGEKEDERGKQWTADGVVIGGIHGGGSSRTISVVYELEPLEPGAGGTACLSGTHEPCAPPLYPHPTRAQKSPLACPQGLPSPRLRAESQRPQAAVARGVRRRGRDPPAGRGPRLHREPHAFHRALQRQRPAPHSLLYAPTSSCLVRLGRTLQSFLPAAMGWL